MAWWASRLRRDAREARGGVDFVELFAAPAPRSASDGIEVVLANERRARVRTGFDAELLREVQAMQWCHTYFLYKVYWKCMNCKLNWSNCVEKATEG